VQSLVALLLLAAPPTLTIPKEIAGEPGAFIVVRAESDSPWVNFRADSGLAVFPANLLSDRKATVVTARAPGRFTLHAYTGNVDGGVDADVVIVVGGAPPVPPGPQPPGPVPPGPTPPPVVAGKREVVIFHESSTTTASLARLYTALRIGAHNSYLRSKSHTLEILDVDNPSSVVAVWKPHLAGVTLPVLFIIDAQTRELLHKESIAPTATADSIIAKLKEHGG
jgi:hypothetical protein